MIFVTLGSQKFQFNRLLKAIDHQIEEGKIKGEVFCQRGYSDYSPHHFSYVDFMNADDFQDQINECDLVIAHSGTGSIIKALKAGKKVIVVPRKEKFHEHVDDHQIQIAKMFEETGLILACYDENDLYKKIEESASFHVKPYISNTDHVLDMIGKDIEDAMKG